MEDIWKRRMKRKQECEGNDKVKRTNATEKKQQEPKCRERERERMQRKHDVAAKMVQM